VSEFLFGGVLTICFKRFAARSEMLTDIVLPSSSVRGLCFTTVAHKVLEVEKLRLGEISGCIFVTGVVLCVIGRGIVLVTGLVRQARKKAAGS